MSVKRKRSNGEEGTSAILDGRFFKIVLRNEDGSVEAECLTCSPEVKLKRPTWKGYLRPTSNFIAHLKAS